MKKYFLLILITISILFMSCNPDGPGIFYKISIEQQLSDSDLAGRSVYKVVELNAVTYVLSGGVVFKESGSDWNEISSPENMSQAVSLEVSGSVLYCVYNHKDTDNSTLYSATGSSWTANGSFTNVAGGLTLVASNSTLFVVERNSSTSYTINNLAKSAQINVTNFVRGAANNGTLDYILASPEINNYLSPEIVSYDGSGPTFAAITVTGGDLLDAFTEDSEIALGGIYTVGTDIYITTRDGFVMKGTDILSGMFNINTEALDNEKLGAMDKATISGSDYLLIGSNGGYYEMLLSGTTIVTPTAATTGNTDYVSVDLYREIVYSIKDDSAGGFFIGTNNGLWHSSDTYNLDLK